MNKLLKLKAGEVLRNDHKLAQLYVSFHINSKFSIYASQVICDVTAGAWGKKF